MTDPTSSYAREPRRWQLRAAQWVLALAVLGSVMALGAVHTIVLVCVTLVLAVGCGFAWLGAEPAQMRSVARVVLWVGLALTTYTFIQAVPIPASWLTKLSPASADIWAHCLSPLREPGPRWVTISLDPGATRVQVLRGVAYVLTFLTAVRIARRGDGVAFLEGVLMATCVALALATWVNPALSPDKVFGLYKPLDYPGARHMAPLVNSNVLSGYLNIGLCLLFAQAVMPRPLVPRPIAVALVAFLVATQLWVASRGGMLAMACGVVLVMWMSRRASRDEGAPRRSLVVLFVLVLIGLGTAVLASSDDAWREVATLDVSKFDVARQALGIIPTFPLLGIGRGAFESVFPDFRTETSPVTFTHPENIVAQWATEWGVAVALAAGIALLWALRPRSALARPYRAIGSWAALACLGVHNLVDFSSESPGVVIALTVCSAIVTGGSASEGSPQRGSSWARYPRAVAIGGSVVAALAILLVLPGLAHDLRTDKEMLRSAVSDAQVSSSVFRSEVRAAMLRHPAEPYFPFLGAVRAGQMREGSVVPWIGRTLDRARVYGPAHLLLARTFVRTSPAQARFEYRTTVDQAPELGGRAMHEVLFLVHGYDDAVEVAGGGPRRELRLGLLVDGVRMRLPATGARLDEDLQELQSNSVASVTRSVEDALADLRAGEAATWCTGNARGACIDVALAQARRLVQLAPTRCPSFSLLAQVLIEAGDETRGVTDFLHGAEHVPDWTSCLKEVVGIASGLHVEEVVTQALDDIARGGCLDAGECATNLTFVATNEEARGNPRLALAFFRQAHAHRPDDDALLMSVGRLASGLALHAEALGAYEELARRHPANPRWQAAVQSERNAVVGGTIKL